MFFFTILFQYIQPPWCAILTSRAFWALCFYLLCDGVGYFVVFTGFPIYMKQALGFDISLVRNSCTAETSQLHHLMDGHGFK